MRIAGAGRAASTPEQIAPLGPSGTKPVGPQQTSDAANGREPRALGNPPQLHSGSMWGDRVLGPHATKLIVDRDPLYTAQFRELLRLAGVELLRLPPRSPNLNAYAERFVLSIKSECLRKVIPLGQAHLRTLVREYVEHYHEERNHQGLGNVIPLPIARPTSAHGTVRRRERLGGLLSYYFRDAA